MEPNKLENQIAEKLNSREIKPSAQAWDRLDAMLSVSEGKKTKRPFGWLYIAASILVFVTAGTFFNLKNTEVTPVNAVVVQEKDSATSTITKFQTPIAEESQQNGVVISSVNTTLKEQQVTRSKKPSIINQKTNNNQNQIIKDKEIEYQNTEIIAQKNLPKIIDSKPIVVKNELNTKADELLVANLDNVVNESSIRKSTVKVNAKSLLSQIDGELDQTFRETKLEKIQRNFKTVKAALTNRNNQ